MQLYSQIKGKLPMTSQNILDNLILDFLPLLIPEMNVKLVIVAEELYYCNTMGKTKSKENGKGG